jgi:acyl-CoA thioester hydrolase
VDRFKHSFRVGWSDIDVNAHMRNSAYFERSVDVRILFFEEVGFPVAELMRRRMGPVVMKEEIAYFREILLLEEFAVSLELAGLSEDGSRWRLASEFVRGAGETAARLVSAGGWLDLESRRLIRPPRELLATMERLARTPDFEILPSGRK